MNKNKLTYQELEKEVAMLREEKDRYFRDFYDNSPNIYISVSPSDGTILNCNQTFLSETGFLEEEIIGSSIFKIYHDDCINEVKKLKQKFSKTGRITNENLILRKKNGRKMYVILNSTAIKNTFGETLHCISSYRDITRQRKSEIILKESESRFKKMFESHNSIMLMLEPNTGAIIDANESAIRFYGYDKLQLCSMNMDDINTLPEEQLIMERIKAINEEMNSFIFAHKLANDEIRTVEVHSSPISFHEKKILFSIIHDITDRTIAQQALSKSLQDLKELNATKDKLFSIISHDLRSPFSSIIGLSSLLTESAENLNSEESKGILEMINTSSKSALNLLDTLLEWAKTQRGQIHFNPVQLNLEPIITDVFDTLKTTSKIKEISLNFPQSNEIDLIADANMLKTVLYNLISNAIKFSYKKSKIDIYAKHKGNNIEISVVDHGVGIEKEIIDKLFSINNNITTRGTLNEKGSGLGLLICKEFIQKHDGQIWIESEVGKGSAFKFTVPSSIPEKEPVNH
ncbi:PAS domain-containing sensor histidine kinase [Polaribacter litorisediminis]|uniref:sensor histidine kinase n=1 Tax=Polaribacter litorisediminis TaxID=1908341 RepID=UPI001CBC0C96|nr:PAS domain-containing sensor histidine kinase [Polaribacter litorisediminis]UAM99432.1 PAS domain-containing sensor histidine kinase [Polaribacter litorisediminis]